MLDSDQPEIIEQPSVKAIAFKYGVIFGLVGIFFFILTNLLSMQGNSAWSVLNYVLIILSIVLCHNEYKKSGDGYMAYGKGLLLGTLEVTISSLISSIFFYLYITFYDTGYLDVMKDTQLELYKDKGMTDSQIDAAMKVNELIMTPEIMFGTVIFGGLFGGFILSLIVTAFTKKNNPEFEL